MTHWRQRQGRDAGALAVFRSRRSGPPGAAHPAILGKPSDGLPLTTAVTARAGHLQ